MACSKYTLTNTGTTIVTFNYQRCDDALWQYQVELLPTETKNIWLLDNTYSSAFPNKIVLIDEGNFPFLSPTPTPSITASNTPMVTPTHTPTPTNILRTTLGGVCHSEFNFGSICNCPQTATIFVNGTSLADSTLAWSDQFGPNTGNPEGYYLEEGIVYLIGSDCGVGCISGSTITPYSTCVTPTPTVTTTNTPTPTSCQYGDCYHYVEFTVSGDTTIEWGLCPGSTSPITYSSDTYPATFVEGPTILSDCFSGNSYTILSGSPLVSINYFNPCCEELTTPTPTPSVTNTLTPTQTPSETPTNTPTPSITPTNTETVTPTPTTPVNITLNNNTTTEVIIDSISDDSGPITLNFQSTSFPVLSGQTLTGNHPTTDNNPVALVSGDTSSYTYVVYLNSLFLQSGSTVGALSVALSSSSAPIYPGDIVELTITD